MDLKIVERNGVAMIRRTFTKPTGSGRRVGWLKIVTGIDRSQKNGYALQGEFLNEGEQEVPAGSVVVCCAPAGSAKSQMRTYDCFQVESSLQVDGNLGTSMSFDHCSPSFLDQVQARLDCVPWVQTLALASLTPAIDPMIAALAGFTTEQLEAELERRQQNASHPDCDCDACIPGN